MIIDAKQIERALHGWRFNGSTEKELQSALASRFDSVGLAHQREKRLGIRDRVDFWFDAEPGALALEVKIGGSMAELIRQLFRYADHEIVRELVVVTTRMQHRVPAVIVDKPCRVIWVGRPL